MLKYGDRIKYRLANQNTFSVFWKKVRNNKIVYALKDLVYLLMNRIKTEDDKLDLSGTHIVCFARKE
jgi:hypothetical protein